VASWKWVIPALCLTAELAFCGNDKAQANGYDTAWKDRWVRHCRQVLNGAASGQKTAGFVLQIGDSISHDTAYSAWPRAGSGRTSEDSALCAWINAANFPSGTADTSSTNGFYLAVTGTVPGFRGLTASRSLRTAEFLSGNNNGGPAMPAETNASNAKSILANTNYTGNLHYVTVASAFPNAQIAVIMFGTNDVYAGESTSQFIANMGTIVDAFENRNVVCVISTIPPLPDTTLNARVDDINAAIRTFARNRELPLIDYNAEIYARRPGTSWNGTLMVSNDVHPSSSGGGFNASSDPYASGGDSGSHRTGDACSNVGYLLRSWLTVQKLKEVREYVVDGVDPRPTARLTSSSVSVNETAASTTLTVSLNFAPVSSASVNLKTSDGSALAGADYQAVDVSVTFGPNETSKTVSIPLLNDALDENAETFSASLSSAVNATIGSPASATITIQDDDPQPSVVFAAATRSAGESDGGATVEIVLNAASGKTVSVGWSTRDKSAGAGDYSGGSGTITFQPGETQKSTIIPITSDAIDEDDETFEVLLANPSNAAVGAVALCTVAIADDDTAVLQFAAAASTVNEPAGVHTIALELSTPASRVISAEVKITGGTAALEKDYTATLGSIVFAAGEVSKTVQIKTLNDDVSEGDETIELTLTAPPETLFGAQKKHTIGIVDDEAPTRVQFALAEYRSTEADGSIDITLELTSPSRFEINVSLSTADGSAVAGSDFENVPAEIIIPAGLRSMAFSLRILDDDRFENTESARFRITAVAGAMLGERAETTLVISDNDVNRSPVLESVTVNPQRPYALETVSFTASASDPDEQTLVYSWDFGDGSSALGASVEHAYAVDGLYVATLTVSDGLAGVQNSIQVPVRKRYFASAQSADDDNDGFSDTLEAALNTDPLDPESVPQGVVTQSGLGKAGLKLLLNFKKAESDSAGFQVFLKLPSAADNTPTRVIADVGGLIHMLQPEGADRGRLRDARRSSVYRINTRTLTLSLSVKERGTLAENFADEGFDQAPMQETKRSVPVTVIVQKMAQNLIFRGSVEVLYRVKSGKGTAR